MEIFLYNQIDNSKGTTIGLCLFEFHSLITNENHCDTLRKQFRQAKQAYP